MAAEASEQHPEYLQVLSAVAVAVGRDHAHEDNSAKLVKLSDISLNSVEEEIESTSAIPASCSELSENGHESDSAKQGESGSREIERENVRDSPSQTADGSTGSATKHSTDVDSQKQATLEAGFKFLSDIPDLVIQELNLQPDPTAVNPMAMPASATSNAIPAEFWVGRQHEVEVQTDVSTVVKEESTGAVFHTTLENFQVKRFHMDGSGVFLITNIAKNDVKEQQSWPEEALTVLEIFPEKVFRANVSASDAGREEADPGSDVLEKTKRKRELDLSPVEINKKAKTVHEESNQSAAGLKKEKNQTKTTKKNSANEHDFVKPVLEIGRSGRVRKLRPELVQYMKAMKADLGNSSPGIGESDTSAGDKGDGEQNVAKRKRGRPRKIATVDDPPCDRSSVEDGEQVHLFTEKKRGRGRPRKGDTLSADPEVFVVGRPRQPGRPRKIGQRLNERRLVEVVPSVSSRRPGRPRKDPVTVEEPRAPENANEEETSDALPNENAENEDVKIDPEPNTSLEEKKPNMWVDRAGNVLQSIKHYFDLAVARTKRTFCADCLTNMHGNIKPPQTCPFFNPRHTVTEPEEGMSNVNIQSLTSLPTGLCLIKNKETNKMAVYAFEQLKPLTQYGPLVGILLTEDTLPEGVDLEDIWFLRYEEQGDRHFLYCGEPENSNWCRFVQESCAEEANMLAVMKTEGIFFITTRTVSPMEPLKVHVPYYGNKERPFVHGLDIPACPRCEVKFRDMIGFQKHFHIYHPYGLKNKKLACSECGCVFPNRKTLKKHSKDVHGGRGGIDCPQCERVFYYESQLAHHMTTKHPDPSAALECPKCAKIFKSEAALRSHLQRTHSNLTYSCPTCDKTFPHKSSMLKHQKHIHDKQYKFVCAVCERGFPDTWALKNHIASHNKNKIYVCQTCHISFSSRYLVRQHLVSVHGLEKVALPSDPPDSEEVEVLYEQVLEEPKELMGKIVELTASRADLEEGKIGVENQELSVEGSEVTVATLELVDEDGQHFVLGEDQELVIGEEMGQIKVLSADDVALRYTVETEEGEQWTV